MNSKALLKKAIKRTSKNAVIKQLKQFKKTHPQYKKRASQLIRFARFGGRAEDREIILNLKNLIRGVNIRTYNKPGSIVTFHLWKKTDTTPDESVENDEYNKMIDKQIGEARTQIGQKDEKDLVLGENGIIQGKKSKSNWQRTEKFLKTAGISDSEEPVKPETLRSLQELLNKLEESLGTTAKEILPNKNRSFSLLLKSYGDVGKLKKEHFIDYIQSPEQPPTPPDEPPTPPAGPPPAAPPTKPPDEKHAALPPPAPPTKPPEKKPPTPPEQHAKQFAAEKAGKKSPPVKEKEALLRLLGELFDSLDKEDRLKVKEHFDQLRKFLSDDTSIKYEELLTRLTAFLKKVEKFRTQAHEQLISLREQVKNKTDELAAAQKRAEQAEEKAKQAEAATLAQAEQAKIAVDEAKAKGDAQAEQAIQKADKDTQRLKEAAQETRRLKEAAEAAEAEHKAAQSVLEQEITKLKAQLENRETAQNANLEQIMLLIMAMGQKVTTTTEQILATNKTISNIQQMIVTEEKAIEDIESTFSFGKKRNKQKKIRITSKLVDKYYDIYRKSFN